MAIAAIFRILVDYSLFFGMSKSPHAYTGSIPNTPLRFTWYTLRPYWKLFSFGLFFSIASQLVGTYSALYIGYFTDAVVAGGGPDVFLRYALGFTAIGALLYATFRIAGFVAISFILKQHARAFDVVCEYLLKHSHTYFTNRFAGTLAGKVFHAGDRSSELILMTYYGFVRVTMVILSTGVAMAFFSLTLAALYALVIMLAIILNYYLVRRRRPYVVAYANATSRYRGQLTDVVTNISAVRQYAALEAESAWIGSVQRDRIEKDRVQWKMAEYNHLINNVLGVLLLAAMVGGTYLLLLEGSVALGAMVTVMILMYRVSGIMVDLGDWMNRFIRVYGEVEEGLSEILIDHEIVDRDGAGVLTVTEGKVAFKDVSFEYGANAVFKDFNLTITPGQRVGLVGPSGAGKTTLVSLLLRQHELQGGTICIDDADINTVTQASLREAIAVVPQEPALFHRTIRENIAYGKPGATDEEIIEVAKKAQAHDFISALPEGYHTLVGERGVKLSGGQKQRVAIARAMLKDAPILVLDEATSALDSESEVAIQKALHALMVGKTVIAIAHRLSTLREMDRLVVLENGAIVEDGTHETLARAGGTYQRLWEHQAGGFLAE